MDELVATMSPTLRAASSSTDDCCPENTESVRQLVEYNDPANNGRWWALSLLFDASM